MAADVLDDVSPDIDYIEYLGPSLAWGRILSTCVLSMWRNDTKCKYMFMFPLKYLAHKGLKLDCSITIRPIGIIKHLTNYPIGMIRDLMAYSVNKGLNCVISLYELPSHS